MAHSSRPAPRTGSPWPTPCGWGLLALVAAVHARRALWRPPAARRRRSDCAAEAFVLGLPFPPLGERFDLLEETVQACLLMWEGGRGDGRPLRCRHVRLERSLCVLQSLCWPHPPLLIVGSGGRRALPWVAESADPGNLRSSPDIPCQLVLLRRLCAEAGQHDDANVKAARFGFGMEPRGGTFGELTGLLCWLVSMGIMGRGVILAAAEL